MSLSLPSQFMRDLSPPQFTNHLHKRNNKWGQSPTSLYIVKPIHKIVFSSGNLMELPDDYQKKLQKLCKKSISFARDKSIEGATTGEKHSPEE